MSFYSPRAQPETKLDVDTIILDFLLFDATRALLREQVLFHEEGVREDVSQGPVRMVDSFIQIFKCSHPTARLPPNVNFRLRLLKFTALFAKRNTPSEVAPHPVDLERVRRRHRKRAEDFYDSASDSSFQDSLFEQQMGNESRRQAVLDTQADEEIMSLADLVPMFIGVSAARALLVEDTQFDINGRWMELAGEFMLQAALEQCLEYPTSSGTKLQEIFSWGWRPSPTKAWEDEQAVNDMFCDDESLHEIQQWSEIRERYIALLRPKSKNDLPKQLQALTRRFPLDRFEETVLRFLEAMQLSQDEPLLQQLDTGHIPGMSRRQVEELRRRIGAPH